MSPDEELVPVHSALHESYGVDPKEQEARYALLRETFSQTFGAAPEMFARAPGRVNLIGEHIDYEGYGVIPMAIKQDTVVAVRKSGNKLVVSNLKGDAFPTQTFGIDPGQEVDVANHNWANYFVCAYKGAFELLKAKCPHVPPPCGLHIMVDGTVPLGSGLSSSAALVCSSMLAVLAVHGVSMRKADVAEFAAKAERYVGVTSGGMDQAISMMGKIGVAELIDFNPVRASDVALPPNAVFVVANCLAVSNKAEAAPKQYNMRVVECRLAAMALARACGLGTERVRAVQTLREVEPIIVEHSLGGSGLDACLKMVQQHLHEHPYTCQELEAALECSLESLFEGSAASLQVLQYARGAQGDSAPGGGGSFMLRQRAQHVYEEAKRVLDFKAVCEGSALPHEKLASLAGIMNESHRSCRELYNCSYPELEELTHKAKADGALASRLTGAGWGGCAVSLVNEGTEEKFLKDLKASFYDPRVRDGIVQEQDMPKVLFASKPSSGAAILKI